MAEEPAQPAAPPPPASPLWTVVHEPVEEGACTEPAAPARPEPASFIQNKVATSALRTEPRPAAVQFCRDEPRDIILTIGAGEAVVSSCLCLCNSSDLLVHFVMPFFFDVTQALEVVELFVQSLRATGSRAEVVLFLDRRVVARFMDMARQYGGVRLLSFDAEALQAQYGKVVIYRFVLYTHFLAAAAASGRYRRSLHADLFDTLFQVDPFAAVEVRDGLAVFAENPDIDLGACRFHRYWFSQCHEAPLLYASHTLPRVCMGVVMGTLPAMLRFLQLVLPHLEAPHKCNDQGVLNILLWSGELAAHMPVTIYTAVDGPVINANTDWNINWADTGLVQHTRGHRPYAVVHQYDRLAKSCAAQGEFPLCFNGMSPDRRRSALNYTFSVPKYAWSSAALVPVCIRPGAQVLCVSDQRARLYRDLVLFCPTRTPVAKTELSADLTAAVAALPSSNATASVLAVLRNDVQRCISTQIMQQCHGRTWCPVTDAVLRHARSSCPATEDVPAVVFACLLD